MATVSRTKSVSKVPRIAALIAAACAACCAVPLLAPLLAGSLFTSAAALISGAAWLIAPAAILTVALVAVVWVRARRRARPPPAIASLSPSEP